MTITVRYHAGGHAEIEARIGLWADSWRGQWSEVHPRIVAGTYLHSHCVGNHRGRRALVQQGVTPVSLTDGRRGWYGINLHDVRGPLLGCIGVPPAALLDIIGRLWDADGPRHPRTGGPLITLVVT